MTPQTIMLILLAGGMLLLIAAATHFSGSGNLDNIKSKTVGDGQHGTARWANRKEIQQTYRHIPFHVSEWRSGKNLPKAQGLVLGCVGNKQPPAKPGVLHIRAKPWNTSLRVSSRKYDLPAAKNLLLAARKRA